MRGLRGDFEQYGSVVVVSMRGRELYGDTTLLANGQKATTGYQALAEEDSNGDGQIDANDANWNELHLWQDRNQDGYEKRSQLVTFKSEGVARRMAA
jgi:hypothetical protein